MEERASKDRLEPCPRAQYAKADKLYAQIPSVTRWWLHLKGRFAKPKHLSIECYGIWLADTAEDRYRQAIDRNLTNFEKRERQLMAEERRERAAKLGWFCAAFRVAQSTETTGHPNADVPSVATQQQELCSCFGTAHYDLRRMERALNFSHPGLGRLS
jgi:hypothetical protein